jgi:hypothetical protein
MCDRTEEAGMSKLRSRTWFGVGERVGFGVLRDEANPEHPRVLVRLELPEDGDLARVRVMRIGVFDSNVEAVEFEQWIDATIDNAHQQSAFALQGIQQVGEAMAGAIVNLLRDLKLSPEQFATAERAIREFAGISEMMQHPFGVAPSPKEQADALIQLVKMGAVNPDELKGE